MSSEVNKAMFFELGDELLRSWWTIVAGLCIGVAGAMIALNHIPRVYQAVTKIRIVPQSIPEEFIESTVTDDMSKRLGEVQQVMLTRDNMLKLIEDNFPEVQDPARREAMTQSLQKKVVVFNPRKSWLFYLRYNDTDPERAANVVNTLTRMYIEQNKQYRSGQAEDLREQFETQASDTFEHLTTIATELQAFNSKHRYETEAFLDANLQMLDARQRDMVSNSTRQADVEARIESLRLQLEQIEAQTPTSLAGMASADAQRVAQLRQELKDLRNSYHEGHPEVARKQRQLDDLLKSLGGQPDEPEPETPSFEDPRVTDLRAQITASDHELANLEAERTRLVAEVAKIERRIEATPTTQSRLTDLEERHRVAEERYRDMKDKAEKARKGEFLEESEQGQRLEVIERATPSYTPISPDPRRIYAIGIVLGCTFFVGPLLLRRLLNPIVSSEAGLRALIDVPVLVSVPRIPTTDAAGGKRGRLLKNISMSVLSSAVLAVVILLSR